MDAASVFLIPKDFEKNYFKYTGVRFSNEFSIGFVWVPLSKLHGAQPKNSDPATEMVKVLQKKKVPPIAVQTSKEGFLNVLDGNTRVAALRRMGATGMVPCVLAAWKPSHLKSYKPLSEQKIFTFTAFLAEAKMDFAQAVSILGLPANFSHEDIKAKKKELNLKYHPDRPGGDVRKVQDINAAADFLLSKNIPSLATTQNREAQYAERRAAREKAEGIAKDIFESTLKSEAFQRHFERIFQQPFTTQERTSEGVSYGSFNYRAKFQTDDTTIVLEMLVTVYYDELIDNRTMADANSMLRMYITSKILYNRKQLKLFQRTYQFSQAKDVLTNPNILFPEAKLKEQMGKSVTRKFSKRDALLVFSRELQGQGDNNDGMWIPLGPNYKLYLYRTTLLGSAAWHPNGLYQKSKRVSMLTTKSFMETPEHMHPLFDWIKKIQSDMKKPEMEAFWNVDAIEKSFNALKDVSTMKEMKSFGAYLMMESPHETETPVPVSKYLPNTPNVSLQPLIPDVLTAIKTGMLRPSLNTVSLPLLIPTQRTVSLPKVERYLHINLAGEKPAIALNDKGKYFLLDGHHRVCGEILKGLTTSKLLVVTKQQLDAWHQTQ